MKRTAAVLAFLVVSVVGACAASAATAQWRQPGVLMQGTAAQMVSDSDGGVLIASVSTATRQVLYRKRASAATPFGSTKELLPCTCYDWDIAMNGGGTAVVAWFQRGANDTADLKAALISAAGVRGATQQVANLPLPQMARVTVAIDDSGRAYIVTGTDATAPVVFTRPAGGSWSAAVQLSATPLDGTKVATIATKGAHVVVGLPLKNCRVAIARRAADGSWSTSDPDPGGPCATKPAVSITADGAVDAAWMSWGGANYVVKAATAADGGTFSAAAVLGNGDPRNLAIRRLATGNAVVAWESLVANRINVRRRTGATWGGLTVSPVHTNEGSTGFHGMDFVRVAIGPGGTAVVAGTTTIPSAVGVWQSLPDGSQRHSAIVPDGSPWYDMQPLAMAGGEVMVAMSRNWPWNAIVTAQFTTRTLPPLRLPTPRLLNVTQLRRPPAGSLTQLPAGAVLPLKLTITFGGIRVPARVQVLRAGQWVTIAAGTVQSLPSSTQSATAIIRARLTTVGVQKIRVIGGSNNATYGPFTVNVRPATKRRIPVGTLPYALATGGGGVWVAEGLHQYEWSSPVLRNLAPASGATRRTMTLPDYATTLSVGPTNVWLTSGGTQTPVSWTNGRIPALGARLTRIDAATGAARSTIPGYLSAVSAGPSGVWVSGACPITPTPTLVRCDRADIARRVDAASGQFAAPSISLLPDARVQSVGVTGSRVWVGGDNPTSPLNLPGRLADADATTGAIGTVTSGGVSPAFTWYLNDTTVMDGSGGGLLLQRRPATKQVLPQRVNVTVASMAADGSTAWALERDTPNQLHLAAERLVQIDLATSAPTGRTIALGTTYVWSNLLPTLQIHSGVAWVLHPDEAAVLRVALAATHP